MMRRGRTFYPQFRTRSRLVRFRSKTRPQCHARANWNEDYEVLKSVEDEKEPFVPLLVAVDQVDGDVLSVHVAFGIETDLKAEDILSLIEGELGGVQEHFVVGAIDQLHKVVDHPSVPKWRAWRDNDNVNYHACYLPLRVCQVVLPQTCCTSEGFLELWVPKRKVSNIFKS